MIIWSQSGALIAVESWVDGPLLRIFLPLLDAVCAEKMLIFNFEADPYNLPKSGHPSQGVDLAVYESSQNDSDSMEVWNSLELVLNNGY